VHVTSLNPVYGSNTDTPRKPLAVSRLRQAI
jgi:hypothetical protein